jgi:hypothetical protein
LIPIQYTRQVGRNGTLEATRGAPVPATVMSGRLLKSEMMRTMLGRNLCRVSSICRHPVGIQASSDKETNCERVDLAAEMIEELLLV